jgi:hypothetical protein
MHIHIAHVHSVIFVLLSLLITYIIVFRSPVLSPGQRTGRLSR